MKENKEYRLYVFCNYVNKHGTVVPQVFKVDVESDGVESTVIVKRRASEAFLQDFKHKKPECILVRNSVRVYHEFELQNLDSFITLDGGVQCAV